MELCDAISASQIESQGDLATEATNARNDKRSNQLPRTGHHFLRSLVGDTDTQRKERHVCKQQRAQPGSLYCCLCATAFWKYFPFARSGYVT